MWHGECGVPAEPGAFSRPEAADGIRTHNIYLGKVALYH